MKNEAYLAGLTLANLVKEFFIADKDGDGHLKFLVIREMRIRSGF